MIRKLSLLALPLMLTFHCAAASFVADFHSGADPRLQLVQPIHPVCGVSPCETVSYAGNNAQFDFTTGGGENFNNMNLFLVTSFGLAGNYAVSVDVVTESIPNFVPVLYSAAWLQVGGTTATMLEWATSPSLIGEYVDASGLPGPQQVAPLPRHMTGSPTPVTFEIQRLVSGGTAVILFFYDLHDGNGPQPLFAPIAASAGVTGPVMIGLAGYGTREASVTFDNLTITADGFTVPEPATWSFGLGAVLIGLLVQRRRARKNAR